MKTKADMEDHVREERGHRHAHKYEASYTDEDKFNVDQGQRAAPLQMDNMWLYTTLPSYAVV